MIKPRELLEEEISRLIVEISRMDYNEKETGEKIANLKQLYEIAIIEKKSQMEIELKREQYQTAFEEKEKELKEMRIDRWFRLGTAVGVTAIELGFYMVIAFYGFKFEETGSLNSSIFKFLLNRFKFNKN